MIKAVDEPRIANVHFAHGDVWGVETLNGPALMWDLLRKVGCLHCLVPEPAHAARTFRTCSHQHMLSTFHVLQWPLSMPESGVGGVFAE